MISAEDIVGCSKLIRGVAQPIPARYIVTLEEGVNCCEVKARLGLLQDAEAGVIVSVLHSFAGSVCTCSLCVEANTAGVRMVRTQLNVFLLSSCNFLLLLLLLPSLYYVALQSA